MRENTPYSDLFQTIGIKIKRKADEQVNELGLNAQQGRIIGYIYEHQDEGLIQKNLADAFNRRDATITSMLKGLEKNGYIVRKIPADNERQKNLYVLPKGEQVIQDIEQMFATVENEIVKSLTDEEQATLMRLLTKVNQNL
ncbi:MULTISPECIES: MarR family winged helix-turn-helix transcriptional regulator [Paenibacillus]|uniref:MarR family transcriptional regulator n=1 Tax=Paenibacillus cucumis (ex Kampfer et al. 2016) TaxID=1776858 RepID=A0ABS7KKS4_9BACL|nr:MULTISPECIES: MarR family transcriptional regulator [Paenibacillus]MBY0204621.1 MarR family transcriptional regulator [Paenibacillus cucumis (ex Kampfer et al. 2016)]MDP9702238.1 DNA-binding MarR family transcriptional regulator [Paenibacillus intestini]